MVIYYTDDGIIEMVNHDILVPHNPGNLTLEELRDYYKKQVNLNFFGTTKEWGQEIFYYKVICDEKGNFIKLKYDENLKKEFEEADN